MKNTAYILSLFFFTLSFPSWSQSDTSAFEFPENTINDTVAVPADNAISFRFVKGNRVFSPDSTLFDIAIVTNNTSESIRGKLKIEVSKKWSVISEPEKEIDLKAGESYYFPLRIAIPNTLKGGYSYLVAVIFDTPEKDFSKNLYITIPRFSDWDIEVETSEIYFNTLNTDAECEFKLSNRGNAEEIVKVKYEVGKLLEIEELKNEGDEIYYVVPAHTDTIITHKILFKKGLSDFEKERYSNNYRESTLMLHASASDKNENRRVAITKLESEFDNHKGFSSYISPLNVEWQVYNLLTSLSPRYNFRVFGRVLLQKNRTLDYHVAGLALPLNNSYENISLSKNLFFRVLYTSRLTQLMVASNVGSASLLNSYGMGVNYRQTLGKRSHARIIVTKDRFLPIYSAAGIYNFNFNSSFGARAGLGYYSDEQSNHQAASFLLGSNFSLFKSHRFDLEGALSFNQFNPTPELPQAEEKLGFSYKFRYNVAYTKFQMSIYSLNKSFNYFRNSNNFVNNVNATYIINPKNRLSLNFYHNSYLLDFYPYRFLKQDSWIRNTFGQLLYTRPITARLFFSAGPEYQFNHQDIFVLDENYNKVLENTFYGVYSALTYKLNEYSSISPNIRVGMANTKLEDSFNATFIETDFQFSMRFGINYTGKYLRVLAFYQRGPLNISDQAFITNNVVPTAESYQFRPYYERYFFDKAFRLSTFLNYIYLMPSGRQLLNWNVTADVFLEHGWEFGLSNNSFSNQYVNNEQSLITNRGINVYARVKKSFDLQQPRVKFYDLSVQYFNDLNGNGVMDKNERPLANVKAVIERNTLPEEKRNANVFVTRHLVSDPKGRILMENIPDGNYQLHHAMLKNTDQLFFAYGDVQEVILNGNFQVNVPLIESYKINGKVGLDRDPNSRRGLIDLTDIRVTATTQNGDTYFGLTDKYGNYTINIPPGNIYRISVRNVFGQDFSLEKSEFIVEMYDVNTVNIDFTFIEKRRGVKMNGENHFNFNLEGN